MKLHWTLLLPVAILSMGLYIGCSDDDDEVDAGTDPVTDPVTDPTPDPTTDPVEETTPDPSTDPVDPARWVQPEGTCSVWIEVIDGTESYTDGQLGWKGEMLYDDETNMITFSGWDGPFALLYDDGPWTDGGHEARGQTAGDHVLSTEVFIEEPDTDPIVIGYGMEDENHGWVWNDPDGNGSVTIPLDCAGGDPIEAPGMEFTVGTIDFRLTLDSANLLAAFLPFDDTDTVTVKGTFSGWAELTMYDDATHGDAAEDGIYTFLWSENLPTHGTLMSAGVIY